MIKLTVFVTADGRTFPATELVELSPRSDRVARYRLRIETLEPISEGWLWDADNNATTAHKAIVETVDANNSTPPGDVPYRVCLVDREDIDIAEIPGLSELRDQQHHDP